MTSRLSRLLLAIFCLIVFSPVQAQISQNEPLLLAGGGGYRDIYASLTRAVISRTRNNHINLLVLPMNLTKDETHLSEAERKEILAIAEDRRQELESVCKEIAPAKLNCSVVLAPILTRTDARNPQYLKLFNQELSGILLLDGNKELGLEVLVGTPLEFELVTAYERGVVVAGTGAGSVMLSNPMIGEYLFGNTPTNALAFGAVQVWDTADKHGLLFGVRNAFFEDRFFQEGDLGKMLNVISLPNVPDVGIGLDTNTGVYFPGGVRIENVVGDQVVVILDGATYHSSEAVHYRGTKHLISLRNVLVHTLAPGAGSFDLIRRAHSLGMPYQRLDREYTGLQTPTAAGMLMLTGDLSVSDAQSELLNRFITLSGSDQANILIYAAGYPSRNKAEIAAAEIAGVISADSVVKVSPDLPGSMDEIVNDYTGILLTIDDPAAIDRATLTPVEGAWRAGMPVLGNKGAVEIIGKYFTPSKIASPDGEGYEPVSQSLAMQDEPEILPGMGWIDAIVIPNILEDNRWSQMFTLAYHNPKLITIGLPHDSAIELSASDARAMGTNVTFALDLRRASLAKGTNNGLVIANGFMDVFAPGDIFSPVIADIHTIPERHPTPALVTPTITQPPTSTPSPSPTPTVTASPTPSPTATQRVKPTPTPLIIPPPSDPETRNWMIVFGVLIVVVIVIGILLNRRRIT